MYYRVIRRFYDEDAGMKQKNDVDSRGWSYYVIWGVALGALLILNYFYFNEHISSNSDTINAYSLRDEDMNKTREAAVAGMFYPADVYQLSAVVDSYLEKGSPKISSQPRIIIVPHAGYIYSAAVAAKAYQKLLPFQKKIKNVILIGPSHFVAVNGVALPTSGWFNTPLGSVPLNRGIINELATDSLFVFNDKAHAKEHSLEVQLPFLQKILKDFSIVPMVYGHVDTKRCAEVLHPYLQRDDTLIIVSADLSHYLDDASARAKDEATAQAVRVGKPIDEHASCGAAGINTALILAKEYTLQPRLLDMSNSGQVSGDTSSVVGYASWLFRKEEVAEPLPPLEQEVENLDNFARHHGEALRRIVRHSLETAVNKHKVYKPSRRDFDDVLFNKGASFVTLTKNGSLRGCIGSLMPGRAIALDVSANAYAAAMEDSRFQPLTAEELPQIDFSISLLTGYERIEFKDETDVVRQLKPGTDGIVIRDGDRQGLFLPSVWEQLPSPREFLNNLKLKAGLSPSYWSDDIKVYRFRVVEIKNEN